MMVIAITWWAKGQLAVLQRGVQPWWTGNWRCLRVIRMMLEGKLAVCDKDAKGWFVWVVLDFGITWQSHHDFLRMLCSNHYHPLSLLFTSHSLQSSPRLECTRYWVKSLQLSRSKESTVNPLWMLQLKLNSYPSHLLAKHSISQNSELLSAADKLSQREWYKILHRCCQQQDLDGRSPLKGGIYACPNVQPVAFPILCAASEKKNCSFCNTC